MNIQGLQKLSLLDYPGRVACTIFTGGCNLRCPFCHNADLVLHGQEQPRLEQSELLSFLAKRRGVLEGVCVSGGEPLLQEDLGELLQAIRGLGYAVKLDTNGCFPERLEALLRSGLVDYVAMDIKNAPQRYAQTVGLAGFDLAPVQRSVELLSASGVEYEFRTTAVRGLHDAAAMRQIGQWLSGAPRYFIQQFVDSGRLLGETGGAFTPQEMEELLAAARCYLPCTQLRGIDI